MWLKRMLQEAVDALLNNGVVAVDAITSSNKRPLNLWPTPIKQTGSTFPSEPAQWRYYSGRSV